MNVPVITNSLGKEERDFGFELAEGTEVHRSCGLTWRGENYIFGGDIEKRQISKIVDCGLERVGSLSFNFTNAACTNLNDEIIYLCFDDGPSFGGLHFKLANRFSN